MGRFSDVIQRLWRGWTALQVEFQGRCSIERLSKHKNYMEGVTVGRVTVLLLLSPLPCLILAIMVESVPLAPPGDGVRANWVFLIRFGFVTGFMVGSLLYQMGKNVPALVVKWRHTLKLPS